MHGWGGRVHPTRGQAARLGRAPGLVYPAARRPGPPGRGAAPVPPADPPMLRKSIVAPVILIVLGTLFLGSNLGWLPRLGPLFATWWPLVLVVVGVSLLLRRL